MRFTCSSLAIYLIACIHPFTLLPLSIFLYFPYIPIKNFPFYFIPTIYYEIYSSKKILEHKSSVPKSFCSSISNHSLNNFSVFIKGKKNRVDPVFLSLVASFTSSGSFIFFLQILKVKNIILLNHQLFDTHWVLILDHKLLFYPYKYHGFYGTWIMRGYTLHDFTLKFFPVFDKTEKRIKRIKEDKMEVKRIKEDKITFFIFFFIIFYFLQFQFYPLYPLYLHFILFYPLLSSFILFYLHNFSTF